MKHDPPAYVGLCDSGMISKWERAQSFGFESDDASPYYTVFFLSVTIVCSIRNEKAEPLLMMGILHH